jgi:5-methylcytosine-specific restriction endonuclease McrA
MTETRCREPGCAGLRYRSPTGDAKPYCSAHRAVFEGSRRARLRPDSYVCRLCGRSFTRAIGKHDFCGRTCSDLWFRGQRSAARLLGRIGLTCVGCGVTFDATRKRLFHDDACAKRTAVRADKARRRAAGRIQIRIRDLCERDGWRCGLCHRVIRQDLAYPHPGSASLDHILPVSLGGAHVYENVQAAHLRCNRDKGAKVLGYGEQLRLIP